MAAYISGDRSGFSVELYKSVVCGTILAVSLLQIAACGKEKSSPPTAAASAQRDTAFSSKISAALESLPTRAGGGCAVDRINGTPAGENVQASRQTNLVVVGWAALPGRRMVPITTLVQLVSDNGTDKFYAVAKGGGHRPDVARALKNPVFESAGFSLSGKITDVPAGKYDVKVLLNSGSDVLVCNTKRSIQVQQ